MKHRLERNENDEKITPHEHNLVALGDKMVTQTALATVENPDTESQQMYINKDLANNSQLKSQETQEYSVYTFGHKKPKKVATSLVKVKIK